MRVKKNNLEVEITCPYCKSILIYNKKEDVKVVFQHMTGAVACGSDGKVHYCSYVEHVQMIECPCCKRGIRIN